MIQRLLPALALILSIGACMEQKSSYELAPAAPALTPPAAGSIAVVTLDERPYVLDGSKSADFIGTDRGEYSNTVDVVTASGKTLADEVTSLVVNGYAAQGTQAVAMAVPRKTSRDAALATARGQGEKVVAVTIHEWRTDSYTRVKSTWNLEATVYDSAGTALGRSQTQGALPIGVTTIRADPSVLASEQLSHRIAQLLNERRITDALK
jgi:ABC-type sugar transport system substrate-binding protein